jgi:WD repeat-containing protein 40A
MTPDGGTINAADIITATNNTNTTTSTSSTLTNTNATRKTPFKYPIPKSHGPNLTEYIRLREQLCGGGSSGGAGGPHHHFRWRSAARVHALASAKNSRESSATTSATSPTLELRKKVDAVHITSPSPSGQVPNHRIMLGTPAIPSSTLDHANTVQRNSAESRNVVSEMALAADPPSFGAFDMNSSASRTGFQVQVDVDMDIMQAEDAPRPSLHQHLLSQSLDFTDTTCISMMTMEAEQAQRQEDDSSINSATSGGGSFADRRPANLVIDTSGIGGGSDMGTYSASTSASPTRQFSSPFSHPRSGDSASSSPVRSIHSSTASSFASSSFLMVPRHNSSPSRYTTHYAHNLNYQPTHTHPISLFATSAGTIKNPRDMSSIQQWSTRRIPTLLREQQYNTEGFDKVFASVWLSDVEVVYGTKCNRILVLNTVTGKKVEIPSIVSHVLNSSVTQQNQHPSLPQQQFQQIMNGNANYNILNAHPALAPWPRLASLTNLTNSNNNINNTGPITGNTLNPITTANNDTNNTTTAPELTRLLQPNNNCYGIHTIAINPSRTLLAVGSGKPTQYIQIYALPTFDPVAILSGHKDMVFSVDWVTDTLLVSGSRDMSVSLWDLQDRGYFTETATMVNGETIPIIGPCNTMQEHRGKVRDLKYNKKTRQAATLSTDGYVKLFDVSHDPSFCSSKRKREPQLSVSSTLPLYHTNETVCLALDEPHNMYAVGSQSHISLLDPRCASLSTPIPTSAFSAPSNISGGNPAGVVHMVESKDNGWGVRSISLDHSMMTVGGGYGRISFYDLRAQKYLSWDDPSTRGSVEDRGKTSLEAGDGWLLHDAIYMNYFSGHTVRNAVYTLAYDPTGVKLFAAGGPLQLNLYGSYVSVW